MSKLLYTVASGNNTWELMGEARIMIKDGYLPHGNMVIEKRTIYGVQRQPDRDIVIFHQPMLHKDIYVVAEEVKDN